MEECRQGSGDVAAEFLFMEEKVYDVRFCLEQNIPCLLQERIFLIATLPAQKHAGSVVCVYKCIPSLNFRP